MHTQPFLEALSAAQNADITTRVGVGLALLQQYAAIRDRGPDATVDGPALASLLAQLDSLPDLDREVIALRALADALPHWDASPPMAFGRRLVHTALIHYGQALLSRAAASLAVVVLELAAVDTELDGDDSLAAQARLLCGFVWRMLGNWEASESAYERAYELAWSAGEFTIALRTRVGLGYGATARGDLPGARALLRTTAARASRLAPEALPYVYLAQGNLESVSGRYEEAVALGYRAYEAAEADETMRYASLIDLAHHLVAYGAPEVAEKAVRAVLRADVDMQHRLQAQLYLLFLSAKLGRDTDFFALSSELADAPFTVRQRAMYQLHLAAGLRTFGKIDDARTAAQTAIDFARGHSLFQLMFEAEEELRTIDALAEARPANEPVVTTSATKAPLSKRVARVARAIDSLLYAPEVMSGAA